MTAREIIQTLNGRWHGRYGTAPCPVCQPEGRRDQDALTVRDGDDRLLMICRKSGCQFKDLLSAIGIEDRDHVPTDPRIVAQRAAEAEMEEQQRARRALELWHKSMPVPGTLGEIYLREVRGITARLPETIRFVPECWHGPSNSNRPALVSAVTNLSGTTSPCIHRTYLESDGSGKAKAEPAKMVLGRARGGCVVISSQPGSLVVAEGIETGLSLASGLIAETATIVSAVSASGMSGLFLPSVPGRLIIAMDGDDAGSEAGSNLALRAGLAGWQVEQVQAPDGYDFNDVLCGRAL